MVPRTSLQRSSSRIREERPLTQIMKRYGERGSPMRRLYYGTIGPTDAPLTKIWACSK